MMEWNGILLITTTLAAFRLGTALKCYDCYYASGDVPNYEIWRDKKINCLNTKFTECDAGRISCRNATLFYTGRDTDGFRLDVQSCGSKETDDQVGRCEPFRDREATSATRCRCETDLCNIAPNGPPPVSTQSSTQDPASCNCACSTAYHDNQFANVSVTPVPVASSYSGLRTGWFVIWILLLRCFNDCCSPGGGDP